MLIIFWVLSSLQPYPRGFLGRSPCFWCLHHSSEFLPMTFRSVNFRCCRNTPWTVLGTMGSASSAFSLPFLPWQLGRYFIPTAGSLPARFFRRGLPSLVQAWLNQSPSEYGCGGGGCEPSRFAGILSPANEGLECSSTPRKVPCDTPGAFCWLLNDMTMILMTPPSPEKVNLSTYQLLCDTLSCVFHCFPLGSVRTHYSFLFVFIKMGTSDKHSCVKLGGPPLPYLSIDSFFWTLKHMSFFFFFEAYVLNRCTLVYWTVYLLAGVYAAFY